jgi:plastocyanin
MMRARYLVIAAALLGADSAPPRGGTVEGSVATVLKGNAYPRKHVYVYLEQLDAKKRNTKPGAGKKFEIRQIKREFVPRVLVVPVGATVFFPNLDKENHNVFSPTDPVFDLGRYPTDKKGKSHVFEDDEEFDIFCDVHQQMWAKVKAVDSPYWTRVVDGKFTFANIPAGKYKVVAWTPNSAPSKSGVVVVSEGASVKLDRELHLQVTKRSGCHKQKTGTNYPPTYSECPEDDY